MPVFKIVKNNNWRPNTYYYINAWNSISKAKWKDKKADYKREEDGNYFLDYSDAFKQIHYGTR
jgi:hypothetical protein